MRSINLTFLAILVAATFAVAGGFHGLHIVQVGRQKAALKREAERAEKGGRVPDALTNWQRYLALSPGDDEALAQYALLAADHDQPRRAFFALERALRVNPHREDLRRKLVKTALENNRPIEAQKQLAKLYEKYPDDAELLYFQAECHLARDNDEAAVAALRQSRAADAKRIETCRLLVELLERRLRAPGEAAEELREFVKDNPENASAYVFRGEYALDHRFLKAVQDVFVPGAANDLADDEMLALAAGDAEKAIELAKKAIEQKDFRVGALVLAARCAEESKQYGAARTHLEEAKTLAPQSEAIYGRLAELEVRADPEAKERAMEWLKTGLKAGADKKMLLWNLANLQIDLKLHAKAAEAIKELKQTDHPKPLVRYLEARRSYGLEKWLAASRAFEGVRPELADWPEFARQVDFYLGVCYEQLGKSDQQLSAFRRAVDEDPLWVPARIGAANALLSMGAVGDALDELRPVANTDRANLQLYIDMARLMFLSNLALDPGQRDWRVINGVLDQIAKEAPQSPYPPLLRAEILVADGKIAEAKALLEEARDKNPGQIEPRTALAALALRQKEGPQAEDILRQAKTDLGDSVAWRLAAARMHVARQEEGLSDRLRELAIPSAKMTKQDRLTLWRGLAPLTFAAGDFEQLQELCTKSAKADAQILRVRLLLFDLALRKQREDQQAPDQDDYLKEVLSQIKDIEGQGPLWNYGEAVRLLIAAQGMIKGTEGDRSATAPAEAVKLLDAAKSHLTMAKVERPAWSRLALLTAQIDDLLKNDSAALANYRQAIDMGERDPVVVSRVMRMLYDRQRYTEADDLIRKLQTQQAPFTNDLERIAADVSLQLLNFERALDLAKRAAADSEEPRDHIWLGQVHGILSRNAPTEEEQQTHASAAEEELKYAISRKKEAPEGWVALVGFFARGRRIDRARETIAEADQVIGAAKRPLAIASCFETVGDLPQAEDRYRDALAQFPNDPDVVRRVADHWLRQGQTVEAEKQLNRIVDRQLKVGEDDLAWGRRNLALLLSQRNDYQEYLRSIDLVEENLKIRPDSLADLRMQAIALAAWPGKQARDKAITMLERVVEDSKGAPVDAGSREGRLEDRFILASLYAVQARHRKSDALSWDKASNLLVALIAEDKANVRYLATYVRLLLDRGEAPEAERWLERLKELAETSLPIIELRSQILTAVGRHDEAIELLRSTAARTDLVDSRAKVLRAVAQALERNGHDCEVKKKAEQAPRYFAEAEKQYRELVSIAGESPLELASFLVRRQSLDEALSLAEASADNSKPDRLAAFGVAVLQESAGNETVRRRLETLIDAAIQSNPDAIGLHAVIADIWSWRGDFDEAEERYRWILEPDRKPGYVVALNNLALLLALRKTDLKKASALIEQALRLAGPRAELLDSQALVYLARGDSRKALQCLQEAIGEAPTPSYYFHRALAMLQAGDPKRASESLAAAEKDVRLLERSLHPLEQKELARLRRALP